MYIFDYYDFCPVLWYSNCDRELIQMVNSYIKEHASKFDARPAGVDFKAPKIGDIVLCISEHVYRAKSCNTYTFGKVLECLHHDEWLVEDLLLGGVFTCSIYAVENIITKKSISSFLKEFPLQLKKFRSVCLTHDVERLLQETNNTIESVESTLHSRIDKFLNLDLSRPDILINCSGRFIVRVDFGGGNCHELLNMSLCTTRERAESFLKFLDSELLRLDPKGVYSLAFCGADAYANMETIKIWFPMLGKRLLETVQF